MDILFSVLSADVHRAVWNIEGPHQLKDIAVISRDTVYNVVQGSSVDELWMKIISVRPRKRNKCNTLILI